MNLLKNINLQWSFLRQCNFAWIISLSLLLLSNPAIAGSEQVIYRETFPNTQDKGQPLSTAGWQYHLGPQGWNEKDNPATQGLINENKGGSSGLPPVASNSTEQTEDGFVVNGLGSNGNAPEDYWNQLSLYLTHEFQVDLRKTKLTGISFDLALSQPDQVRVVVQVDGKWYASKQTFTAEPIADYGIYGEFAEKHVTHTLNPNGRVWLPLNFEPNVTLGLNTAAKPIVLPKGMLEGFGLLLKPTGFEAFDTFTLTAVSSR